MARAKVSCRPDRSAKCCADTLSPASGRLIMMRISDFECDSVAGSIRELFEICVSLAPHAAVHRRALPETAAETTRGRERFCEASSVQRNAAFTTPIFFRRRPCVGWFCKFCAKVDFKGSRCIVSLLQGSLHSALNCFPTTAGSAQFCLLCCQPELVPESLPARPPSLS